MYIARISKEKTLLFCAGMVIAIQSFVHSSLVKYGTNLIGTTKHIELYW
jgi:hypothetical protein